MQLNQCQERGFHSWRADADDAWSCVVCGWRAIGDPAAPCPIPLIGKEHRWLGHDQHGLLCAANSPWNTAKRVHCACGAARAA